MNWIADPQHSSIEFSVKHLGISWIKGRFLKFKAEGEFDQDNLEGGALITEIDTSSITTFEEKRDNHLKSQDFFDVENYPAARFKSSEIKKIGDNEYDIFGDLTIRETTKPVVLKCQYLGTHQTPSKEEGGQPVVKAAFTATTTINRHDFGVNWDMPAGEGISMAGADVDIIINVEMMKK